MHAKNVKVVHARYRALAPPPIYCQNINVYNVNKSTSLDEFGRFN